MGLARAAASAQATCSRTSDDFLIAFSYIAAAKALDHVYGYAVGIDMTRRDLQGEAKKIGRPWEVGKAFELSAPCSAVVPASRIGHPSKGAIWLTVNGDTRQRGDLSQLIWSISEALSHRSNFFTLAPATYCSLAPCGRRRDKARRPAQRRSRRGGGNRD